MAQGIVLEVGVEPAALRRPREAHGRGPRGVRDLGYHATLGVAPTPLAARLFARAEAQGTADAQLPCAWRSSRGRIAELPLFLLDWPERTLALLADLGVLRIRDILALPREGLAQALRPARSSIDLDKLIGRAARSTRALRAAATLPLAPRAARAKRDATEALLFPLRRLLVQMEGFLRGRGAGVQHLALALEPVRAKPHALELEFASPEREADFILSIAREKLGRTHARRAHARASTCAPRRCCLRAALRHLASRPRGAGHRPRAPARAPRRAPRQASASSASPSPTTIGPRETGIRTGVRPSVSSRQTRGV